MTSSCEPWAVVPVAVVVVPVIVVVPVVVTATAASVVAVVRGSSGRARWPEAWAASREGQSSRRGLLRAVEGRRGHRTHGDL